MRAPVGPGLLLLLAVGLPQSLGLKCGIRAVDVKSTETVLETGFFPRIVGWRNSTVGGHPWQVSLKLGEHHCCGGSLIQEDLVVTAAHCLVGLSEKQIKSLTVTAGQYSLSQKGEHEQKSPVSKIIIHPEYNRLGYMSSDIALLYLKHKVEFGTAVQPICLPHRDDKFEAEILCMTSGWCKISETSEYSNVLREVELPIMDDRMCNSVLKGMNFPLLGKTMMCASFPDEEKDACQGDSGGPFVCRRDSGIWVLAGITSWRAGWTRDWTSLRTNHRRASLGIFSKVFELMDFSTQNIFTACRSQGTVLFGEKGKIHYPHSKEDSCSHNCLCMWRIMVPEDKIILIKFTSLDVQNQVGCDHDYISLQSSSGVLISICGIPPFSLQWLSRRIVEGEEACPHCWPWQVGVRFLGSHQCGGAILNPTWILTAAHCVQSKNNPLFWTIVAGDHDRTLKEPTGQVRRVKRIVAHEDFDRRSADLDIALIQLTSPLKFNSVVRPVCLPQSTEPLLSSEICAVTGLGSVSENGSLTRRLQQIRVSMLESEGSERTYSSHPGGLTEKMMCAGFADSGGKDFCQGDSGGPLVCRHEKGPFVLYGIAGWGAGCAQPRKPGVFARASVFLDWIQSKIKGPASLQINNESKILPRQQLPPPTPSTDNASGPGCYSEVELEEPRDFFSTPGYPLDYRGELECSWVLRVSPNSMAKLTVEYLSMPWSPVCPDSVMTIYEESHDERRVSGELCGRGIYPMIFMSSGPLVRVAFHSLVQGALDISYIVFRVQGPKGSKTPKLLQSSNQERTATWEDVILTKPGGIIQIPRYSHRTVMSCHWKLSAPLQHVIRLDIINSQMKPTPLACQGHMWVYEGFGSGKKLIDEKIEAESETD
ncbi:ovochymase-1 [Eumetopias jubatus]|uniref:ovochymase-1 n=1 Tax=Eumetopias jubatus TaxID=34886 RepID=UPI001016A95E|nr:ovochymase-1 [Eumetopias jubatus]